MIRPCELQINVRILKLKKSSVTKVTQLERNRRRRIQTQNNPIPKPLLVNCQELLSSSRSSGQCKGTALESMKEDRLGHLDAWIIQCPSFC